MRVVVHKSGLGLIIQLVLLGSARAKLRKFL